MCGRFGLTNPKLLEAHGLLDAVRPEAVGDDVPELLEPRYNIAPSQPVLAARTWRRDRGGAQERSERRLDVLRWGLIPSWAKDAKIGHALANARAETVAAKPAFRGAWKGARRALVFADAFFEWRDLGDATADPRNGDAPGEPSGTTGKRRVARAPKPRKQPYAIRLQEDAPFAFGGLWDAWRDPAAGEDDPGAWVTTCTLITTAPNRLLAQLHDRMPVIVPREHYDAWLDPETPLDQAHALLAPYAPEVMRAYPVSTYVNSPAHDDPHVLDPLPNDQAGR
jgi:putative SOS response-associated peptidase YedK